MTILAPIIIALFYGLIIYFSIQGVTGSFSKIAVVNENKTLSEKLKSNKNRSYEYVSMPLAKLKSTLKDSKYDYILYLPDFELDHPDGIEILGSKQAGMTLSDRVSDDIEELIRNQKLKQSGLQQSDLDKLRSSVDLRVKKIGEAGKDEESSAGASTIIAYVAGILMFMFIMLYGIQVMRGVIEEKTSRIIEIMISSVKPFQLMMGKIIGIALVGLTQFILWIVFTAIISTVAVKVFVSDKDLEKNVENVQQTSMVQGGAKKAALDAASASNPMNKIQKSLASLNVTKIVTIFLFFFLGGYLFYSALYAAIGSAVDSETETQQFMLPVMMPLFLGYALSLSVVTNDPYGPIAFWLSMIPFTSPIAMMVRLPYGVPDWQLALSMVLLILGFIGTVWVASKIYRVGILMYGKKTSMKEMIKWFTYKN
jgi:ABC-2 type transport system permease protein